MNILILVLSLLAGAVGTGVGGILGVLLKSKGNKVMSRVLSFAGGVMVGIVVFEMIPESIDSTKVLETPQGVFVTLSALFCGILITYGLNKLLDKIENVRETHRSLEELHHETKVIELTNNQVEDKTDKKSLLKAGLIMLLAIMFHNVPEGMAIGATGSAEEKTGILIAILIAVHNIPEGMAISAPLASGGMKAWKTIVLTFMAGAATVLGAVLGQAIGGMGDLAIGICMGIAGGAMLYVTFCEIIPQSILMDGGRIPAASMLIGILSAMLFVYLF